MGNAVVSAQSAVLACIFGTLLVIACGSDSESDGSTDRPGSGGAGLGGSFDPGGGNAPPLTPDGPLNGTPGRFGSYALGDPLDTENAPTTYTNLAGCGTILTGVVRDFKDTHSDFEKFSGSEATLGMVGPELGFDSKPVYTDNPRRQQSSGQAAFDTWYRNTPGENMPFFLRIELVEHDGLYTFESDDFFPVDGAGFGNQGRARNYHFTTEFHTQFRYSGGESFRFTGDDDLWVFINRRLAIDLGGLHPELSSEIRLDEAAARLGLERGQIYPLSLFHAERHTEHSHFRIDTTLTFVNCGDVTVE